MCADCASSCVPWVCGVSSKAPGDGDLLWLLFGWWGSPPESQPLEILQGTGKDGGGCDGGQQGYGNTGGGCADPGRDGDVELHKGGYWDVGLCTGVGGIVVLVVVLV